MLDVLGNDLTQSTINAALGGHMRRQELIAHNIANANTPEYRRKDVSFQGKLQQALSETQDKDQQIDRMQNMRPTELQLPAAARNDGGGVSIDQEMAAHAKNTIRIQALQGLKRKRISSYRKAIMGNQG